MKDKSFQVWELQCFLKTPSTDVRQLIQLRPAWTCWTEWLNHISIHESPPEVATRRSSHAACFQDPYNMERVFWLLLGKDGASVKVIMEEFQHSHRHRLPEHHHKLVRVWSHLFPQPDYCRMKWKFSLLVAIRGSFNRHGEWRGDPGDHDSVLGGKPVCAVSSHCCGCVASLSPSSQRGTEQVQHPSQLLAHTHSDCTEVNLRSDNHLTGSKT